MGACRHFQQPLRAHCGQPYNQAALAETVCMQQAAGAVERRKPGAASEQLTRQAQLARRSGGAARCGRQPHPPAAIACLCPLVPLGRPSVHLLYDRALTGPPCRRTSVRAAVLRESCAG